jgi:hypothetical protein
MADEQSSGMTVYIVQSFLGPGVGEWQDIARVEVPSRTKRSAVIAKAFEQDDTLVPPDPDEVIALRVLDEASAAVIRVGSRARDPELVIGVEDEPS